MRHNIFFLLISGFILRITLASFYDTADTGAFCQAGTLWLEGKEVYANPNVFFSAPPFGLHLTGIMFWIGNIFHIPCNIMWKFPTIIADIGIGILIYKIAIEFFKKSKITAVTLMNWYMFNPIALFISGFQGQQEGFWLFFIILSYYIIKKFKNIFISAVCTGIALSYKVPAILLVIPLVFTINEWKNRFRYIFIVSCIFIVSLLPEIITSTSALVKQSFLYSSIIGIWGISGIVTKLLGVLKVDPKPFISFSSTVLKLLLISVLSYFYYVGLKKKENFFTICLNVILLFLILTPGFGPQYLLWLLPFLILTSNSYLKLYTIVVTVVFLHTYGLNFAPLDFILRQLQEYIYNKLQLLYPYDLYFTVWILVIVIFVKQNINIFLNKKT